MRLTSLGMDIHNRAMRLVQQLLADPSFYKIQVITVDGATVIDCGVGVLGSQQAGLLFSRIAMGGMGCVQLGWQKLEEELWPVVQVRTDHPSAACLGCQHTNWIIEKGSFNATAFGPGWLLSQLEDEHSEYAILCMEGRELPSPEVVSWVARHCHVDNESIYILIAPTASIVGSIQMASRSMETGLYKMQNMGYPVQRVISSQGTCFLSPASRDDRQALGRTNDAIIYGSISHYTIDDTTDSLQAILNQIPSSSAADYGQLFGLLFQRYGNFYNIDSNLFGPSAVSLSSTQSGEVLKSGHLRPDLLQASFGLLSD